ncbi:hypothetical protein AB0I00_34395 [Streptomyces sp. NPDC050803]
MAVPLVEGEEASVGRCPVGKAANPCVTTMMIGEKCADLLKEDAL